MRLLTLLLYVLIYVVVSSSHVQRLVVVRQDYLSTRLLRSLLLLLVVFVRWKHAYSVTSARDPLVHNFTVRAYRHSHAISRPHTVYVVDDCNLLGVHACARKHIVASIGVVE